MRHVLWLSAFLLSCGPSHSPVEVRAAPPPPVTAKDARARVETLQSDARRDRDIVRLNCIDEKLERIVSLESAADIGDSDALRNVLAAWREATECIGAGPQRM